MSRDLRVEHRGWVFHFYGPRWTWKKCDFCQQRRWWLFDYERRRICGQCIMEVVFPK